MRIWCSALGPVAGRSGRRSTLLMPSGSQTAWAPGSCRHTQNKFPTGVWACEVGPWSVESVIVCMYDSRPSLFVCMIAVLGRQASKQMSVWQRHCFAWKMGGRCLTQ